MCDRQIDLRLANGRITATLDGRHLPTPERGEEYAALSRLFQAVRTGATLWIDEIDGAVEVKVYSRILGSYDAPSRIRGVDAARVYRLLAPDPDDLRLPAMIHARA